MQDNKTFSMTLSPKTMLMMLLAVLPILGGGAYYTITLYNKMLSTIEQTKGISTINKRVASIDIKLEAQQERYLELMTSNIRLQEKASDALANSRETKAVSTGNTREVEAALLSIRSEVAGQLSAVEDRMKALQRATTNPLGR
jgi:hypothetical protein